MAEREAALEEILKQLLTQHFYSVDLEWSWREGLSLRDQDLELYLKIAKELPEVILHHE